MKNEIVISENTLPVKTAINEKDGINGLMSSKANVNSLRNCIKLAIIKAFMTNSRELEKDNLSFLVDELKMEILNQYPSIRLEEIGLAIHKMAVGDYGQIYSLSLNAFVGAIRTYMGSEKRIAVTKEFLKIDASKPNNKPSEEEIEKARLQIVLNAFDKYKVNKTYKDYGNYVFNILATYGIINFTEEQKIKIWDAVIKEVFYDNQLKCLKGDSEALAILQELKTNKEHLLFYVEAKKISLNHFFNELVEIEENLIDLIS